MIISLGWGLLWDMSVPRHPPGTTVLGHQACPTTLGHDAQGHPGTSSSSSRVCHTKQ